MAKVDVKALIKNGREAVQKTNLRSFSRLIKTFLDKEQLFLILILEARVFFFEIFFLLLKEFSRKEEAGLDFRGKEKSKETFIR